MEFDELVLTCGYADRYSTLLGGVAYIDYRGKLYRGPIEEDPYATYDHPDAHVSGLPVFVISSGISRDSGNVPSFDTSTDIRRAFERGESFSLSLIFFLTSSSSSGRLPSLLKQISVNASCSWP